MASKEMSAGTGVTDGPVLLPAEAEVEPLVRGAQAGDAQAFDELVRRFSRPIFNLAYRMAGNHEEAEDLAQEIFVKLHRSVGQFRWRSRFSTWLYAVAANTCRSGLRRLRRIAEAEVVRLDADGEEGARPPEPAAPGDLPGQALAKRELRQEVEDAIAELPEEFRLAVILRDLQGFEYEEIAEALQCSMGTVKSRLSRGRQRVKERLVRAGVVA
jgi:RNA polymerase sigma-70 factor (ECF subfamily)